MSTHWPVGGLFNFPFCCKRNNEGPPKTRTSETPWAFAARAWLKFWKRTRVPAPSSASDLISGPMSDPLRILICQSPENLKIIESYIFCSNNCLGHFQAHLKATWKSIMTICLSSRNYMFYNTKSLLGFSGRPEIDLKVFEKHIFHNEICSGPTWKPNMTIRVSKPQGLRQQRAYAGSLFIVFVA